MAQWQKLQRTYNLLIKNSLQLTVPKSEDQIKQKQFSKKSTLIFLGFSKRSQTNLVTFKLFFIGLWPKKTSLGARLFV